MWAWVVEGAGPLHQCPVGQLSLLSQWGVGRRCRLPGWDVALGIRQSVCVRHPDITRGHSMWTWTQSEVLSQPRPQVAGAGLPDDECRCPWTQQT